MKHEYKHKERVPGADLLKGSMIKTKLTAKEFFAEVTYLNDEQKEVLTATMEQDLEKAKALGVEVVETNGSLTIITPREIWEKNLADQNNADPEAIKKLEDGIELTFI